MRSGVAPRRALRPRAPARASRRPRAVDGGARPLPRVLGPRRLVAAARGARPEPRARGIPASPSASWRSLRLLPKHEVPPPPGWAPPAAPPALPRPGRPSPPLRAFPSLVIVAAALATLAPSPLWHHAPGPRLAFQTTTARLLVWRDGVPATAEPLLPLPSVGAHAPALATLAADVSHLSGLDPARSLAAGGGRRRLPAARRPLRPPRDVGAPARRGPRGAPGAGRRTLAGLPLALGRGRGAPRARVRAPRGGSPRRPRLPVLGRRRGDAPRGGGARPAGPRGARRPRGRGSGGSPRGARPAGAGARPRTRPRRARPLAARARPVAARGGGRPRRRVRPTRCCRPPWASCWPRSLRSRSCPWRGRAAPAQRPIAVAVALVAAALLVARVHGWIASGQLPAATRTALARAAVAAAPFEPLCAPEGVLDWVPALASRAAGDPGPWIPPVYTEEWGRRTRRACSARLEVGPSP